ncbi:hypothetical protein D9M71_75110 [compost metagenome]
MLLDQFEHPSIAQGAMGRVNRRHATGIAQDRRAGVHGVVHQRDTVGLGQQVHHAGEVVGERVTDHDAIHCGLVGAQVAAVVGFGAVQRIGYVAAAADLVRPVQGHGFKRGNLWAEALRESAPLLAQPREQGQAQGGHGKAPGEHPGKCKGCAGTSKRHFDIAPGQPGQRN